MAEIFREVGERGDDDIYHEIQTMCEGELLDRAKPLLEQHYKENNIACSLE